MFSDQRTKEITELALETWVTDQRGEGIGISMGKNGKPCRSGTSAVQSGIKDNIWSESLR